MNQEFKDAIREIIDAQEDIEQEDFQCVEFETYDEWLEKLKEHMLYRYYILKNHGNMEAVAEEVEKLWIGCFWNEECECGNNKFEPDRSILCGECRFRIKCKNCICEKCEVPIPDGKSILCGECEWKAICENCECTNNLKYWQAGDLLCEECTTQYCPDCQEGKHECVC